MSIKTWLIAGAAGGFALISALPTFAGGPHMRSASQKGIYAEIDGGWLGRNWTNLAGTGIFYDSTSSNTSGTRGGWTLGGDIGYQANRFFSVETGYWHIPEAKGTAGQPAPAQTAVVKVDSWFAYLAGKASVPVGRRAKGLVVYGKFGPVYTYNRAENTNVNNTGALTVSNGSQSVSDYWDVMYAVGVEYHVAKNWLFNMQYMRVPGYAHANTTDYVTPRSTIYSAGVGYKLAI